MKLNRRVLRGAAASVALTGAMLVTSVPTAHAYWIYQYYGAYGAQSSCDAALQSHIAWESQTGNMYTYDQCRYYGTYPGPGRAWWNGPGWYYKFGIFAA